MAVHCSDASGEATDSREMSVYQLVFPNGKQYIGVAYDPDARFRHHCKSNYPVGQAIRKYREDSVTRRILYTGYPEQCYELEYRLVAELGTQTPNGYNVAPGGRGVRSHSPEMRKIMSASIRKAKDVPGRKERDSKRTTEQWKDEALLEQSRQSNIETWKDPDLLARHSATMREVQNRPEVKAGAIERGKAGWDSRKEAMELGRRAYCARKRAEKELLPTPPKVKKPRKALSPEDAEARARRMRENPPRKGKPGPPQSEEQKRAQSLRMTGRKDPPEVVEKKRQAALRREARKREARGQS